MKFKSDIEVQAGLKDSSGSAGTSGQILLSTATGVSWSSQGGYVPYTGATGNVNLGNYSLSTYDLIINHSSGSGTAASITKGGNGEALTVVKTSGSGNAASITGGVTLISELNLTTDLADAYIASAAIWNAKQNALNGTGFVKISGTTISYDNSTYVPTSRTITINGVSQDLSSDRSWTVSGGVSGSGSAGQVAYWNGTSSITGESNLFWDSTNDRLGIGTPSPSAKLEVAGRISTTGGTSNDVLSQYVTLKDITSTNDYVLRYQNSSGSQIGYIGIISSGNKFTYQNSNGHIFSGGNVGIGTTSPVYKFHVDDTSDGIVGHFSGGVSNYTLISFKSNEPNVYSTSLGSYNSGMLFRTGATDRMYITSGGNVGIGTTSPNNTFDVRNTVSTQIRMGTDQGARPYWNIGRDNVTTGNFVIADETSIKMSITNGGNVGIGTTSPSSGISSTETTLQIQNSNVAALALNNSSSRKYAIFSGVGGQLGFYDSTADAERMRIFSSGNVFIGSSPADAGYKLDVNGTGRFSGTLRISNTTPTQEFFSTGNGDVWGSIKAEASTGTGGQLVFSTKRNGNTEVARVRITENGNTLFYPPNFLPVAISGIGAPYYGANITLASDIGSTQGANRIWSRYDGTGRACISFETATNSQSYQSDPTGLTYTEYMRITGLGDVGINTGSPSAKLHVGGSFITDLDSTYHLGIKNEYVSTYISRTKFGRWNTDSNLEIYYDIAGTEEARLTRNYPSASLKFNRQATTDMMIAGNGNVLIGTTTDAGYKFNVNGSAKLAGSTFVNQNATIGEDGGSQKRFVTIPLNGADYQHRYILLAKVPTFGASTVNAGFRGSITMERVNGIGIDVHDEFDFTVSYGNAIAFVQTSYQAYQTSLVQLSYGGTQYLALYVYSAPGYAIAYMDVIQTNYGGWLDGNTFLAVESSSSLHSTVSYSSNATVFKQSVNAPGFFNSSDIRLKEIVSQDGDTIEFTWKDGRDNKTHVGYIAQEVQKTMPDAVSEGEDGMLSVNYIEVLVKKIQDLENRIKQLEK